ncbi:MAG TPA: hypothetical protein VE954_28345 [Oligoflexus sp.]|uniref:glycosyltransferase family 2 protein n=1 Tax=Oligoflexus sp. TaxID=1971216 RepID=UPI002D33F98C|nr:hypothetical protein [Oligoflexus sp.]HYX37030.1 hypothetical protein [Oligoflexus sp.]
MKQVAVCLIWQNGDEADLQHVLEFTEVVPRVYVVDRRTRGEAYASLDDPRAHYAPFRQKVSLGTALNRGLSLAYEEGRHWLWIFDGATLVSREQLQVWSQKASAPTELYRPRDAEETPNLLRRPGCGLLVSVPVARSLGGWDPQLPAQLVLADFYARFKAAGWAAENVIEVQYKQSGLGLDPWDTAQSLWILMQRRFFRRS